MDQLQPVAAPGVAERAEALADAACDLHDSVLDPSAWSAAAVEEAIESMEITALALMYAHPDATDVMFAIRYNLGRVRAALGLPPRDEELAGTGDEHQAVVEPTPIRSRRRVLGPGYQGVRIPPGRTATGR